MHVDEESGSGLKKRRGSMSSRQSLKSFDNNNKASEEGRDSLYLLIIIFFEILIFSDTGSSFSGERHSNKLRYCVSLIAIYFIILFIVEFLLLHALGQCWGLQFC